MQRNDFEVISAIQTDVLEYLQGHPDAADSADGIRQWWLLAEMARLDTWQGKRLSFSG